jgi:phosphatidylglycerophosphatase A
MALTGTSIHRKIVLLFATGFGLGFCPVASGTAGALPGIMILLALQPLWQGPVLWPALAAAALSLAAIPICDLAERHFGRKDDRRIVADEYLTFPICMLGLPLTPWLLAAAFFTSRLCDVLKPPPARRLQALPGGLGIVADDVIANLYSLALNHLVFLFANYLLQP